MPTPPLRTETWTQAAMLKRVVRYADLQPCYNAFIDSRTPGSGEKENFTIIGPGVSENPDQHVHITEPHGFNIGGARQPPGCVNSQHSHDTAEVFVVHTGTWRFDLGEHGDDAQVTLGPGDVISLPVKAFRGFTNVGAETGFLFAVLGNDDPGRVLWAPHVFELARQYGLVLLDTGELIDTVAGQTVPPDAQVMPVTTQAQIDQLSRLSSAEAEQLVWRCEPGGGTYATAVIGEAGPLDWPQGFTVERLDISAGGRLDVAPPTAPEVIFVQTGALQVRWAEGEIQLHPGDTLTVPVGLDRTLVSALGCAAYRVGGD